MEIYFMLLWLLTYLLVILFGLGGVAFITLMERKVLSLSQVRLGPNKVSLSGLLQPVADGVKLLFKESFFIKNSQGVLFLFAPILLFLMFTLMWAWSVPWSASMFLIKFSSLMFFSLLGIGAYVIILIGWSSVSSFSKLGGMRGMLQSLSFEVALILIFLIYLMQVNTFTLKSNPVFGEHLILWSVLWFLVSLMETNRAPFDLLEGESELISGFNIEMGSISFVFLFLSEYGMIVVLMFLMMLPIFFSSWLLFILVFSMLLMRSCFPRVRYDIMMGLMWLSILPSSIIIFMMSI